MYGNWANAAMALHRLDGLEVRFQNVIKQFGELFTALNKIGGIKISPLENGTNIYQLQLGKEIDGKKLQTALRTVYNIRMPLPDKNNRILISVNETIFNRDNAFIVEAFKKSMV